MANSVDADQTAPIEQSVLGPRCLLLYLIRNYLQQTTFSDAFFWRFNTPAKLLNAQHLVEY